MEGKCIHNLEFYTDDGYPLGLCMNKQNKDKHFEECEPDECEHKELPSLPVDDKQES